MDHAERVALGHHPGQHLRGLPRIGQLIFLVAPLPFPEQGIAAHRQQCDLPVHRLASSLSIWPSRFRVTTLR